MQIATQWFQVMAEVIESTAQVTRAKDRSTRGSPTTSVPPYALISCVRCRRLVEWCGLPRKVGWWIRVWEDGGGWSR